MRPTISLRSFAALTAMVLAPIAAVHGAASAGLTLKEASGARSLALGEAFGATSDDITALSYNPASIESLTTGQASFFYRTGLADDRFGRFLVGSPAGEGSVALSVGYFDAGTFQMNDGVTLRQANVQKDLTVALGYSFYVGRLDVGFAGTYLSSRLADSASATAFAGDLGIQYPLSSRVRLGSAVQNVGSKIAYRDQRHPLPTVLRTGVSFEAMPGPARLMINIDGIFDTEESDFHPALGIEKLFGVVALRGGYQAVKADQRFTVGIGVALAKLSFDYAFGMASQLDSIHTVSVTTRFPSFFVAPRAGRAPVVETKKPAAEPPSRPPETPKPARPTFVAPVISPTPYVSPAPSKMRTHVVRDGETLESIAKDVYGRASLWRTIYNANAHLIGAGKTLKPGQKLMLPAAAQ